MSNVAHAPAVGEARSPSTVSGGTNANPVAVSDRDPGGARGASVVGVDRWWRNSVVLALSLMSAATSYVL